MDRNLLKYKLKHPPVMSMALNQDHLFRQLYALIRESLDRIEELEAKLAKAVAFAEIVEKCGDGPLWGLARITLAELTSSEAANGGAKGGKDE